MSYVNPKCGLVRSRPFCVCGDQYWKKPHQRRKAFQT